MTRINPISPIQRSRRRPKESKEEVSSPWYKFGTDAQFRRFIRGLPCCICGVFRAWIDGVGQSERLMYVLGEGVERHTSHRLARFRCATSAMQKLTSARMRCLAQRNSGCNWLKNTLDYGRIGSYDKAIQHNGMENQKSKAAKD